MKHLFYIIPDWKNWAYWGQDEGNQSEQQIAEAINKVLNGGELPDYVKVIQEDANNIPIHFRVGKIEIKRVDKANISRFHGWFDENYSDDTEREDYFQLWLDGRIPNIGLFD